MRRCIPLGLAFGFLAIGCSEKPQPATVTTPAATAVSDPSGDGIPELVRSNNALAIDLLGKLKGRDGNLFFSPSSVASALAMASTGSTGSTFREIRKVLHEPGGPMPLHVTWRAFLRDLGEAPPTQIRLPNALWCQSGFPLAAEFEQALKIGFEAEVTPVDFEKAPDEAARLINKWAAERTSGKIPQAIGPAVINPETRLVLTGAVYFRANWEEWFSEESTQPKDFYLSSQKKVPVPMMHRLMTRARYVAESNFRVLEIPYADRRFTMVVLLPTAVDGLKDLESTLTSDGLEATLKRLGQGNEVMVGLPRFSISGKLELDKVLADLGMPGAFGPSADFSPMTGSKNDLYLARFAHAATITVDEKGTEATAVTEVAMAKSEPPESKPIDFRADHPFLFLVRDLRSGAILFLGRFAGP